MAHGSVRKASRLLPPHLLLLLPLLPPAQAMHSERILIFEPESSKLRKAGIGAYGNIMVRSVSELVLKQSGSDSIDVPDEAGLALRRVNACVRPGVQAWHCTFARARVCCCVPHCMREPRARALLGQVGIKRRYNNVLVDTDKQQQIEMFLGMKQSAYFPSIPLTYKARARGVVLPHVLTALCHTGASARGAHRRCSSGWQCSLCWLAGGGPHTLGPRRDG